MKNLILFSFLFLISSVNAQWTNSSSTGVPITSLSASSSKPVIIPDGSRGAILCWIDDRANPGSSSFDVYAQKIDSNGIPQWANNGVPVCTLPTNQMNPKLISDGAGGAIICWLSPGSVQAQRIDSQGFTMWATNGITIKSGVVGSPVISSDGSGGAIICWQETYVFSQHINSNGQILWNANGIRLTKNPVYINYSVSSSIEDGVGGAIICLLGSSIITAQRISSSGQILWNDSNGVRVNYSVNGVSSPNICTDGNGGAIINFGKNIGGYQSMFIQRINSNGNVQWDTNGITVCNNDTVQYYSLNIPGIISDGFGGAITCWSDGRGRAIYSQKINSNGILQWGNHGVQLTDFKADKRIPELVSDNSGGAIICWEDESYTSFGSSVYAQRVYSNGNLEWGINGIPVVKNLPNNKNPSIAVQPPNGAIISWHKQYSDVYCSRITTKYIDFNCYIQGFYNPTTNLTVKDTITLSVRKGTSPYNLITTFKSQLDQNGYSKFFIPYLDPYTPYYLQVKHRNSIETWSNLIQITSSESYSQDFTSSASQAFGNNLTQVDTSPVKFAMWGGDVNQDGVIDLADVSNVDNDSFNGLSGYVVTDVNGDNFIDISDASLVDNNSLNVTYSIHP